METAIQQLIGEINSYTILNDAGKLAFRNLLEKKLPTEREQILEAFVAGDNRGTGEIPFNAEQYYTQTFKL